MTDSRVAAGAPFALAPGFRAAAVACGLKASGTLDLALVAAERDCVAAGVFTTNRVQAAPVLLDRERLERRPGAIRAVIANAGCANACTGPVGLEAARETAVLTARVLGCDPTQVLVLSTGVIGRPLDMDKVGRGIAALGSANARSSADAAAEAILTTDTRPKTAGAECRIGRQTVAVRGFAKGAGMIHPNMATMLAVLTTDAAIEPKPLRQALLAAVGQSFNRISVDGDMSTNDTVLVLASGASGARVAGDGPEFDAFAAALTEVSVSLAKQIARDGEGATRLVEITVRGARDEIEAHLVADAIGRSALVKTAIHGGDPNWGRILAAAGSSGVAIDPARLGLTLGAGRVAVVASGLLAAYEERAAATAMREDPVRIALDLGQGPAEATVWTCDFSAEYVSINAHYTT